MVRPQRRWGRLRAYRHRLIFWPVFCGAVIFALSGKGAYGPLWPSIYAALAAVIVFVAIYSSDPFRQRSGAVRLALFATIPVAATLCLIDGDVAGCGITILFFLTLFAIPVIRAERRARKAIARN